MTDAEIASLNRARTALARRRNAIADSIGNADLAAVKAAEDLTHILIAIEAVARALADAGRPYMVEPVAAQPAGKAQRTAASQDNAQTSASQAKDRVKAAVQADRERQPARRLRREPSALE